MQRRIELFGEQVDVTVSGQKEKRLLKIEGQEFRPVEFVVSETGEGRITLGEHSTRIRMAVNGETAWIRAFGRTFSLRILDPVEQAAQASAGGRSRARAPMPGTVVHVNVSAGDPVTRGQAMMTIESMKMLTVVPAPADGRVARVHFQPEETFEKGAVLVSLASREE